MTVYRAIARIGIKRSYAEPLSPSQIVLLTAAIRPGGRGHWPRGKRRNSPPADWPAVRARLQGMSRRGLARLVGVSDRTVRRWLDGTCQPPAEAVRKLRTIVGGN